MTASLYRVMGSLIFKALSSAQRMVSRAILRASSKVWPWFNAFNHPTFGIPQPNFINRRFGQVSSTGNRARQIQLGIKLIF